MLRPLVAAWWLSLLRRGVCIGLCAVAWSIAFAFHTQDVAAATTFHVTSCGDTGAGSLRAMIAASNGDLVVFDQDCSITLGSTVTVTNVTLSGNSASAGSGGGILNNGGTLTVTNTIVAGNTAPTGPPRRARARRPPLP